MNRRALSLVEIIVALVVLGLVAVIAVPRLSRAQSLDPGAELRADLRVLRCAIEAYYQDHGVYPGQTRDPLDPAGNAARLVAQLTSFTDAAGNPSPVRDAEHPFGPYLRDGVPGCPAPPVTGNVGVIVLTGLEPAPIVAVDAGWRYDARTGQITANSDWRDPRERRYADY